MIAITLQARKNENDLVTSPTGANRFTFHVTRNAKINHPFQDTKSNATSQYTADVYLAATIPSEEIPRRRTPCQKYNTQCKKSGTTVTEAHVVDYVPLVNGLLWRCGPQDLKIILTGANPFMTDERNAFNQNISANAARLVNRLKMFILQQQFHWDNVKQVPLQSSKLQT